jgi:hypothetical protein
MYSKTVESSELKKLTHPCPEDGTTMHGTGTMHYHEQTKTWFIDYFCPEDKEVYPIETPETTKLANEIAERSAKKG